MYDSILATLRLRLSVVRRDLLTEWHATELSPWAKLYYIEAGRGHLRFGGQDYDLTPGRLVAIPSHTLHSYDCEKQVTIQWVHFTCELLGGVDLFEFIDCPRMLPPDSKHDVPGHMAALRHIDRHPLADAPFRINARLLDMLSIFLAAADPAGRSRRREQITRFQAALEYIEANLAGSISIADMARMCHMSPGHFSKRFTQCMGQPPGQYLVRKRVAAVQRILWTTDLTLDRIAADAGFSDAFHLSKTFKKHTGMSPREFRAQERTSGP